jgi:hypothetical protein
MTLLLRGSLLVILEGTQVRMSDDHLPVPFWPQALLWSVMTLFFGLFVGIVLQGRRLAG